MSAGWAARTRAGGGEHPCSHLEPDGCNTAKKLASLIIGTRDQLRLLRRKRLWSTLVAELREGEECAVVHSWADLDSDDGRRCSHEQAGTSRWTSNTSQDRGGSSSTGKSWRQAGYVVLSLSQPLAVLPPPFPSASPLYLHIDGLAVAPEFRRQGVGTALLSAAERLGEVEVWDAPDACSRVSALHKACADRLLPCCHDCPARAWGRRSIWLHVDANNKQAQSLYVSLGYTVVRTPTWPWQRQVIMSKTLLLQQRPAGAHSEQDGNSGSNACELKAATETSARVYSWGEVGSREY